MPSPSAASQSPAQPTSTTPTTGAQVTEQSPSAAAGGLLPKHFDHQAVAAHWQQQWRDGNVNHGEPSQSGKPYAIILPPPNVTGSLHMGHALNHTLQDILVRYHRMLGDCVVWIPGSDHASIAVHWLLERQLRQEGTSRWQLGREKFLARAWQFKEQIASTITEQDQQLGVSYDERRYCFTMDKGIADAVQTAFVQLYQDGLIYRAEKLVNWDPVSQTSVSDLEVVHGEPSVGELYHFAYQLEDGSGELVVATSRPETIPGDTGLAVHPDDPRYQHLIGKRVRHPFAERSLPIVADSILVDPEFGTGVVKLTPAHDMNDFAAGQRHQLPMINIMHGNGTMNEHAGQFADLTLADAREAVKQALLTMGLERDRTPYTQTLARSERSGAVLEPMLSTQWYVRAKPLARSAISAVEQGKTRFVPKMWENTYFAWMRDIQDWCISRQLWWGHRIPAWYCQACEHVHVAMSAPTACERCHHEQLRQDEDILDTWFSSALWPFATMGWPEQTSALQRWYPNAVLITSFDIIFFWVARMMMFGQAFMGAVPFFDVYIHALIRDGKGEKMSKTKGNVINPLAMIDTIGCDAFRFTLAASAGPGRDIRWDDARAQGYQKFCNKLWQAFRFAMQHAGDKPYQAVAQDVYSQWICHQLALTIEQVRSALDTYRFDVAALALYHFVWEQLCDWYLECSKTILYAEEATAAVQLQQDGIKATLQQVFATIAELLHPFMPFLSEELYRYLPQTSGLVAKANYPQASALPSHPASVLSVERCMQVISTLRRIRADYGIAKGHQLLVAIEGAEPAWLASHEQVLHALAKSKALALPSLQQGSQWLLQETVADLTLSVDLTGAIPDLGQELKRLQREQQKLTKQWQTIDGQLADQAFLARAPADIVLDKQQQAANLQQKLAQLKRAQEQLTAQQQAGGA